MSVRVTRTEARPSFRLFAAAALVALALSAGDALGLPSGKHPWIEVRTPNFTFFSGASDKRTLEIARKLERFRAVLGLVYKKLAVNAPVPTVIYIFRDDASLTPYKSRFEGRPVELLGYFFGSRDGNYIVLNGRRGADPLNTIYHEYIHYFLNNNLPGLPTWFGEGLAEFYSTFVADEVEAQIGKYVEGHVLYLREYPILPLRDLFAIDRKSKDYNEGDRRGVFYAQSWALVHYLLRGKPERRPELVKFLDRIVQGAGPDEAFAASFETTPEKLEAELRAYIGQDRFLFTLIKLQELGADEGARVAPMSREDVLFRLGDLLAHFGPDRASEAEQHFQESIKSNPSHAPSHAGLGYLSALAERHDDAVGHFEKALALGQDDYLTYFRFGEALHDRLQATGAGGAAQAGGAPVDLERVRELFIKAIQGNPGFAEAYVSCALTFSQGGADRDRAIKLLEAARAMLPSRPDIAVNLVFLHAARGDLQRARHLVDRVLARLGDPGALAAARDTLERFESRSRAATAKEKAPPSPLANMEEAIAGERDPEIKRNLEDHALELQELKEYNRQVDVYNEAVALANQGKFKEAIALIEKLLPQIKNHDLAVQTRTFLQQLKKDAAHRRPL
ncbi:MAG: tetratricopeptide repeat protein [Acidobacteria bacterium]|nr:tetratricopeptide repeat protein [Acidobacteriota bacterium]